MADPAIPTPIPEPLLAHLNELKPVLVKQGCVQLKTGRDRQPSFRLRFRQMDAEGSAERHRSVSLPDQAVADAVAVLLNTWRAEEEAERKKAEEAKRQVKEEHKLYRDVIGKIVAAHGGGRRMRTRALNAFKEAEKSGAWAMIRFSKSNDWLQPGQRGRPPSRASIW